MTRQTLERRAVFARYGLFLALVCLPHTVAADDVSGTFTGDFEARGNYYLERSTRVMMPAARLQIYTPNGIKVRASYVLDVISSASIAQTGSDKDGVHTELRHGIGQMGINKKFDTGSSELEVGVHGTYSTEPDYKSWTYGVWGSLALNEKNTTLMLGYTRVDDNVLSNMDPNFDEDLNGNTFGASITQLLSPVLKLDVGYQLSYMSGFLGNPYRRALVGARVRDGSDMLMGGLPRPENPPDERWRHNLEGMLSWYLPASSTAIQLYLRAYTDDWGIQALTPEPRIYQQLGRYFSLRARYRFYTQDRAWFAPEDGQDRYGVEYLPPYDGPLTNDPKMYRFHSHQIGLRLGFQMAMLEGTTFAFLRSIALDVSLDRGISTSTFGDYWIGTLGGRVLF
ncbi:MAG TPA: DUF3570 domain-containing protein [Polyangiales bacterium]|nr:DUF3570 domain-containing protein [Polyangiales bacterium]